ncbi:ORF39L [Turbot reddish body iridovirus]|uniref:ORF39L n=1 Tax=Turbot reddish body iridovirus TaxID=273651 RepID=E2CTY4_ISKNV|nr:ORF39L [Turbot reddish body iridovirus]
MEKPRNGAQCPAPVSPVNPRYGHNPRVDLSDCSDDVVSDLVAFVQRSYWDMGIDVKYYTALLEEGSQADLALLSQTSRRNWEHRAAVQGDVMAKMGAIDTTPLITSIKLIREQYAQYITDTVNTTLADLRPAADQYVPSAKQLEEVWTADTETTVRRLKDAVSEYEAQTSASLDRLDNAHDANAQAVAEATDIYYNVIELQQEDWEDVTQCTTRINAQLRYHTQHIQAVTNKLASKPRSTVFATVGELDTALQRVSDAGLRVTGLPPALVTVYNIEPGDHIVEQRCDVFSTQIDGPVLVSVCLYCRFSVKNVTTHVVVSNCDGPVCSSEAIADQHGTVCHMAVDGLHGVCSNVTVSVHIHGRSGTVIVSLLPNSFVVMTALT